MGIISRLAEHAFFVPAVVERGLVPKTVNLSIELLETFVVLLQYDGDAARAARQLDINQPSMSKRLRYLRTSGEALTQPWLERRGKRWVLTEEGRRVLPAVHDIVARYRQLTGFVQDAGRPRVRVGCGQRTILGVVRAAVAEFREQRAEVSLRLSTLRGAARIEQVATGILDLAVVTHDAAQIAELARQPLHIETLYSAPTVLICAKDAPWARRVRSLSAETLNAAQMGELPLILPEPDSGLRQMFEAALEAGGEGNVQPVLEAGGFGVIVHYASQGLGVGLVSQDAVAERDDLVVRPLSAEHFPLIHTRLICRRLGEDELDLSAAALEFRAALHRAARKIGK